MAKKNKAKTECVRYDSVAQLAEYLRTHNPNKCWEMWGYANTRERIKANAAWWYGVKDYEISVSYLDFGCAEQAAKLRAMRGVERVNRGRGTPRMENHVVGCIPNVPNYLRGVPKQMIRVKTDVRANPVIDVYCANAFHCGISAEDALQAGVKIANLVAGIEAVGVRVNLYACCGAHDCDGDKSWLCMAVKVKDAKAPLNLLNIAYPITHPAFFRATFLDFMECHLTREWKCKGRPMESAEYREKMGINGLIFNLNEIIENHQTEEQMLATANAYIAARGR